MRAQDCYQLGYVIKTHGLKGELQIFLDADDPSEYINLESMFLLQGKSLVPFFLEYIQINGKKAIIKIEDIDSIDTANELVSCEIHLPLDFLPRLPNGKYYYHELVGLEVIEDGNLIGRADQVYEQGPQRLLAVDHNGTEVLIPVIDEIITNVDLEKKEIHVNLPDGLLDVFLEDHED